MARPPGGRHVRGRSHPATRLPQSRYAQRASRQRLTGPRRAALILAGVVALLGLLMSLPNATAATVTLRFVPTADAYVSRLRPGTNFGSANDLVVDGVVKRGYLRFDLAGVPGSVTRATLRLYRKDASLAGYEVRAVADQGWQEQTITYNTAPPPGALVATAQPVLPRAVTSVDITPLVSGATVVDVVIIAVADSRLRLASRESGRLAPELVVQASSTTTSLASSMSSSPTSSSTTTSSTTSSSTTTRGTTTTTSGTTTTLAPPLGWVNVINDQFDSSGVPTHWALYDGPYGSDPRNCAVPSHVSVSGGSMHMLMRWEASGKCGAGWYTAGMKIVRAYGTIDQRVTVRFRIVDGGVIGHHIIPMRWPDTAPWPQGGEEDYCESSVRTGCSTFLHYGDTASTQIWHNYVVDLTQWHTMRFERLDHVVRAYIDDLSTPVWTYKGSSTTLPDTIKRVVLQQECPSEGCPAGKTGTEDIQIDWITIDNPA
jgi:hypothetical protein